MCGRYVIDIEIDEPTLREIIAEAEKRLKEGGLKTGEIFPSDIAPVIAERAGQHMALPMKWGFPRWDGKGIIINARAETAAQKKTFRQSLANARIAVPSTGFYEWKKPEKRKYLFSNSGILYMAGMYSTFEGVDCFNILTTAANSSMSPYHNRMPVLLRQDELPAWFGAGYQSLLDRVPFDINATEIT